MVAIVEPRRPTRRAHARQCVGSGSCARDKTPDPGTDRNQQYSVTALTDGGGSIVECYAYTAYGQVTFADASGTVQAASASDTRYTYTGREWDTGLSLYHYRARMYDAVVGRFMGRDPIRFEGGTANLYEFAKSNPTVFNDPSGHQNVPPTATELLLDCYERARSLYESTHSNYEDDLEDLISDAVAAYTRCTEGCEYDLYACCEYECENEYQDDVKDAEDFIRPLQIIAFRVFWQKVRECQMQNFPALPPWPALPPGPIDPVSPEFFPHAPRLPEVVT